MSKELSGVERWQLYTRALDAFSKSERIPELFRRIFKDAYLPYRDSETLNLFLKEINEFTYDHSENLGNAYEYLLSILGSQGDAGQFRTPRHIIDFIVEIIAPDKKDRILDPACGTAGFLISSYKHIIRKYSSNYDENTYIPSFAETQAKDVASVEVQRNGGYKGDLLSPDDRIRLSNNIIGYDISPDMVRLSLVNLYLHGFSTPQIFEYDTLTYEERWDEQFDVILANPPFMTPKGGIRPHKRFQIQANRSEVLFVDYIAEHLTINGKAGIIVPEGIIFQLAKAYKALRKNLVENWGLYAVVSLPSGVFQPYAGVKTSILFLDRRIAKRTDEILFVKVENDGFDLGAQRRRIDKNDLPEAYKILKAWQRGEKTESKLALWVKKEKLAENEEYNLTGDRYRETVDYSKVKWPMVKLGEVLEYEQPTKYIVESTKYSDEYKIPVLTPGKSFILGYTNETNGIFPEERLPVIIFDDFTTASRFIDFPFKVKSSAMKILFPKEKNKIDLKFVFYMMQNINFTPQQHKRYWISQYSQIQIPLPPIEVQKEIVAELDSYKKIIDGARQVVENWKPRIKRNIKIVPVKERIIKALQKLLEKDSYLIKHDVNERAITAKLSHYLQEEFIEWDVDHEYNRDKTDPKRDNERNLILPDIIIHERGTNINYVVIEVKKNQENSEDINRLKNIVKNFNYKCAYFINIDENKPVEEWIVPVKESPLPKNNGEWSRMKFNDVCTLEYGSSLPKKKRKEGPYPVMGSNGISGFHNEYLIEGPAIIVGRKGSAGEVVWVEQNCYPIDTTYYVKLNDPNNTNLKYIYYILKSLGLQKLKGGAGIPGLNRNDVYQKFKIPLPPLEIQKQIVSEIEKEERIIDQLKKIIKIYEQKIKDKINEVWGEV